MKGISSYLMIFGLIVIISIFIISGIYITSPTGHFIRCRDVRDSYIVLEPYNVTESWIDWGYYYIKVLDKNNIFIPTTRPVNLSYDLCSPCKYNVTFRTDKPTDFIIFDEYNRKRWDENLSNFALFKVVDVWEKNFTFELMKNETYFFVFDRSEKGAETGPAVGRLIIEELSGVNRTTERTEYREVTKYRTVTRCD